MTVVDIGRIGLWLRVDGRRPLAPDQVSEVAGFAARLDTEPDAVGVLELSGAPGDALRGRAGVRLVTKWERALRRLELANAATVAVVRGDCGGTALDVLLAADYRIATDDTNLVLGADGDTAWPGMGLYRLANQAGVGRLRGPVLFGRPLPAAAAERLALLDEVVADLETALRTAQSLAESVRDCPGSEMAVRRRLLLDATSTSYEEALGAHLAACDRTLRRADRS